MKRYAILAGMIGLALSGCSERDSDSTQGVLNADTREVMRRHQEITQEGILADFVEAISVGDYDLAFGMLHPKLSEAWTLQRFAQDWEDIKKHISDGWKPEAAGSTSGSSLQGAYEQATYRLDSNWQSVSSLDLVSRETDGQPRIVRIQIRVPHSGGSSKTAQARTNEFVGAMLRQEFESARGMLSSTCEARYPPEVLGQIAPILGDSIEATSQEHYRICANTVWYDAVRLTPRDDPATFLELVISTDTNPARIVGLSFKGRLRM
jgi:hypothetical protein